MSKLPYKFGKYILVGKIAQGGMAEIYRAKYLGEGGFVKEVAVKRVLPAWSDNKEFVTMLCDEAKALVNLQHQNIVQIYELGKDGETFYISMEFVEGIDLRKFFKGLPKPADLKFICFIVSEILKALDFAHNRKDKTGNPLRIIHRDISPQNILLSFNGEVKVADFGIAKGEHRSFETAVAQVKGKYAYMSPEQAAGLDIDERTDLYAVGVILYELITGKRLYDASNDLLTIEQVKKSILPNGWEQNVAMGIRPIIRRALQKEVGNRYQTAAEFLADINRYLFANKIVAHGLEFSIFLRDSFKEEFEKTQREDDSSIEAAENEFNPQTKIMSMISASGLEKKKKPKFILAGSILLMTAISVLAYFYWHRTDEATLKDEPVASNQQVKLPTIPPQKETAVPKEVKKETPKNEVVAQKPANEGSTLSVQARPWGFVYVPGVIDKKETPVRGVKVKPGEYVVKVNFEPENKWATQKITVAENSQTTCTVNFEGNGVLSCKTTK